MLFGGFFGDCVGFIWGLFVDEYDFVDFYFYLFNCLLGLFGLMLDFLGVSYFGGFVELFVFDFRFFLCGYWLCVDVG